MKRFAAILTSMLLLALGGCYQTPYEADNVFQPYTQRVNKIALSAGDDQEVNSRIQTVDPWPRYVGDTRIPVSADRMAGAAERYRDVSKLRQAPQPLPLVSTGSDTASSGGQ
jgi:hypothetical protein